ncbi:hypothetical protein MRB53_042247 [Persea americana]|nr:hypothetical protein MRB53_042247 [Persea americana]
MAEKELSEKTASSSRSRTRQAQLICSQPVTNDERTSSSAAQEFGVTSDLTNEPKSPKGVRFASEEAPPVKPPRPADPMADNEATLIEAFPTVDTKVVKAVLRASGGQLEPAFNALLSMSDPTMSRRRRHLCHRDQQERP